MAELCSMWPELGLGCPRWNLGWAGSLLMWLLHMTSLVRRSMSLKVLGFLTLWLASPRAEQKLPGLLNT